MKTHTLILEAAEVGAAQQFYAHLGVGDRVQVRGAVDDSTGFRGFHVSMIMPRPADVDRLLGLVSEAGAEILTPATKSMWGYGGVFRAPDGSVWKAVSESKKDSGPATGEITDLVLLVGASDVKASKRFYLDRGLGVAKSFGGKYVEFDTAPVKFGLLPRKALAKDAGVAADGTGSHRLAVGTDAPGFTDPDGFVWETV